MSRSLLSAKLEGADQLGRALSLLLLHRSHMPTTTDSTRSFTTWVPIVWLRTNMRDRELLSVLTSAVGASVLFENSDLVDHSHGPPIGILPGAHLQICARIISFSLTSPSFESSNPFASWMVDVVDDSCRDRHSTSAARNFHSVDVASSRWCFNNNVFPCAPNLVCAQSLSPKPTRDELWAAADTMSRIDRHALDAVRAQAPHTIHAEGALAACASDGRHLH